MKTFPLCRKPGALVALCFAALLALGLLTAGDYGVYCDQLSEQVILRENLKEYACRFLGETSEPVRYYEALGVQRISESIEIDHGQCAYYPIAWALPLMQTDAAKLSLIWHGYTWLLFMLGAAALYGFLREMEMSRPIALSGMLLYVLCPRFFAEGHYNNKDMALLSLALGCFYLGLRFLKRPTLLRGVLFSLVGAMAANTKIVGVAVWGLVGLSAVTLLTVSHQWRRGLGLTAGVTILTFAGLYALMTPALWNDPAAYFSYLLKNASGFTRWPGVVVFRGMIFEHKLNPLPRYYLPYMMLVTLPLYVAPLCAVGQLSSLRRWARQKRACLADPKSLILLCATVLWMLFTGYVVIARPLIYNGWRHFYFIFAGLVILGTQGLDSLWRWAAARGRAFKRLTAGLVSLCLLLSATGIGLNHPYQYAYYNLLAPQDREEAMELDYWDVSTVNAMEQLIAAEGSASQPLVLTARDAMSWFGLYTGYTALAPERQARLSLQEDAPNAPYLYVNTTYGVIYGVEPPKGYHPLITLQSYGAVIGIIYKADF